MFLTRLAGRPLEWLVSVTELEAEADTEAEAEAD